MSAQQLAFFSGKGRLDHSSGATRVVTHNVVAALLDAPDDFEELPCAGDRLVATDPALEERLQRDLLKLAEVRRLAGDAFVLGMGVLPQCKDASGIHNIDLTQQFGSRSLPGRGVAKLANKVARGIRTRVRLNQQLQSHLDAVSDRLAAERAEQLFDENPDISSVMGLSSMSLEFGKTAQRAGRKYAIHCQWSHPHEQSARIGKEYDKLGFELPALSQRRIDRQLEEFEIADQIWCPSSLVKHSLIGNGVEESKTFVSNLGIDVADYREVADPPPREGPFTILFVGSVIIRKGIHILLEALRESSLRDVRVILNGPADEPTGLVVARESRLLEERGIRVSVDPGDPRRHMREACVFVLPSVEEAFGLVVPEAMAASLPVIVSSEVGAKELVEHGGNGYVFTAGDSEQLASFLELLGRDRDTCIELGKRSRQLAQPHDIRLASARTLFEVYRAAS